MTADAGEVGRLAERARAAQVEWALNPLARSHALMRAAADLEAAQPELTALMVAEIGKPITEAEAEVARSATILRYHAQAAWAATGELLPPADGRGLLLTRRAPRGLVGLITPFNFPLAIPVWKAAPALALGNALLLKPSPAALATATRFVEILGAHLPDGLLALCPGDADTARAVLRAVDALSFTGSTGAGTAVAIAAAERHLPVQTENGGHNSAIVLADSDPGAVARMVARDVVGYAGQKCTTTRRVLVCGPIDSFVEALHSELQRLPIGDPAHRQVVAGPVISPAAAVGLEQAVDQCTSAGATVLRCAAPEDPGFVAPTIVRDDVGTTVAARQELFGPIVVVQQATDVEHAVRLANTGTARLVAAVHTRDLDLALSVADRLRAGMVRVNAPTTGVDFHASFGGEGESGYGPREQGRAADTLFSIERTITIRPSA